MLLLLQLKRVQVFVDLPVYMLGQHTNVGEETPQHVQLLSQQFYPLLQSFVFLHQDLDFLLGLARADLRLLSALPHRDVVPLPPAPVLVAVLVAGLDRLPRHVVVQHGRLALHRVHAELLVVQHRAGGEGGEGGPVGVPRVARVGHVRVGEHVQVALPPVLLRIHRFLLDAGDVAAGGTVRIAIRVLVPGIGGAAVDGLGHVREGGSGVRRRGEVRHDLPRVEVL